MRIHGTHLAASALFALLLPDPALAQVRAWEATLDLPTDEEALPDPNPPFDLFHGGRFNYPYTLRLELTGKQRVERHRALLLENEHLRVTVLPDLGGHLYSCVDKATGAELFYANTAIRKARIGYRGAWAAFGIEFNFPVSHNWMSLSPVDFATTRNADGSASIWIGNVDRPYGMHWLVELSLRPGIARLEQNVTLYNRGPARRRFYWWTNAAVRVEDESRIQYPMRFSASHGMRRVDTWPVNEAGVDLSRVGNHLYGPVSQFSHGSREAFMGVYHPWLGSGVVHYSSPEDAPAKKIWSFGGDADGLDWRRALSDDQSAYVEIQAGLFRNQETYAFLEPQETIRFTEHWLPVRRLGGITRANPEAVLHVARAAAAAERVDLAVAFNVSRAIAGGTLLVRDRERTLVSRPLALTPAETFAETLRGLPAAPRYTVELKDRDGRSVIAHTEGQFDWTPAEEIRTGEQPAPRWPFAAQRSEEDALRLGTEQELNGQLLVAERTYAGGLARGPESVLLRSALGRLLVTLRRYAEAAPLLAGVLERESTDAEAQYYLGIARLALGEADRARALLERAQAFRAFRAAASLELVRLDAREGRPLAALGRLRAAVAEAPLSLRAGGLEVVLLRRLGRAEEARERLRHWQGLDPTALLLREEAGRFGGEDLAFTRHLAGDPERILELAVDYMGLGAFDDALQVLARGYPAGEGVVSELGAPAPHEYPLIAYYRGYCREQSGDGAGAVADFSVAAGLPARYVFPNRPESLLVLRRARDANPADATARLLLGSLLLAGGDAEGAISEWEEARRLAPRTPVLHRNLGLALLHGRRDPAAAIAVLREGIAVDARNPGLYAAAEQAAGLLGRPAEERLALLARWPDEASAPPALALARALTLVELGRFDEAEAAFRGRYFPREEGGTNVREVWVEARLRRALALASAGKAAEAASVLETLAQPVEGLAFTRGGLAAFVEAARAQLLAGDVWAAAGDSARARECWRRATGGGGGVAVALDVLARQRLGEEWDAGRAEAALADADVALESGADLPGTELWAQGLLLRALGREAEARERLRQAFLRPDRQLSHFLARAALGRPPR